MRVTTMLLAGLALVALTATTVEARKSKDPKACEVCKKVVNTVLDRAGKDNVKNQEVVEDALTSYCKGTRMDSKENKLCYYVTPVKRTFSNAVKLGAPVDRICKKLARDTPEVCQLRFPEKLDLSKTDLNKLRVRQLKAILNERGVTCDGCLEKRDYVRRVEETMHMDL